MKKVLHLMIALLFAFMGVANAQTVINFETGDFSQFNNWNNTSSYPWTVVNIISSTGNYCMQSGNAGVPNSASTISATVQFTSAGYITFDANCMGEGIDPYFYDVCTFAIDGVAQFQNAADVFGWHTYAYNVPSGSHTFTWSYTKDGSQDPDGDCFQVDNIVIGLGSACLAPANVTAYMDGYVEWDGVANSYTLRYKNNNASSWTTIPGITQNDYTLDITGFSGDYTIQVMADCDANNWASTTCHFIESRADWYGFVTYSTISNLSQTFSYLHMNDLATVTPASSVFGTEQCYAATFGRGYVWFVMWNDAAGSFSLYKAPLNIYTKTLGTAELMTATFPYTQSMSFNPVDGKVYFFDGLELKSFNPENPGPITSYGSLEYQYAVYGFAINKDGVAYVCVNETNLGMHQLCTVSLANASLTFVGEMDAPVFSMAFDMETGELFATQNYIAVYVNAETGQATGLGVIGGDTEYVYYYGLFMAYDWDNVSENVESVNVYPNPAQGRFTVEGTGVLRVSNMLGQTILTREIDGKTAIELPKGMYIVRLNNATSKLVVE